MYHATAATAAAVARHPGVQQARAWCHTGCVQQAVQPLLLINPPGKEEGRSWLLPQASLSPPGFHLHSSRSTRSPLSRSARPRSLSGGMHIPQGPPSAPAGVARQPATAQTPLVSIGF